MRTSITGLIICIAAYILLTGCDDSPADSTDEDIKLALGYPKGGEVLSIGDDVTIEFKANGDSVSNVKIRITTDNGQNYFHIVTESISITGNGVGSYMQKWIIGREDEYDTKLFRDTVFAAGSNPAWKCNIQIYADDNENIAVESDDFTVNFMEPYYLRYPIGGEVYDFTDTIPVIYMFRTDLMSVIQRHFWSLESNDWSQFVTRKEIPAQDDYMLTTGEYRFIPASPDLLDPVGDSTKIMINDYALDIPLQSGWIKINKD